MYFQSSFLMSILRELPTLEGSIEVKGRVAYVSQQPWVFSASLRQNITFGNKFVKNKYDRILKACALNKASMVVMPLPFSMGGHIVALLTVRTS